ncbi:MAG: valine--tRNA ligase [Nanoarchaeota archaeon]|nr:valine--tRNA ligase [Nanoarchaeota archaeon]
MEIPERYDSKEAEPRWQKHWEEHGIFKFDASDTRRECFSVDTPPPTISGKVHLGHAYSYSQQDFIVRFQRMLGKNIFYPFGTDNNGVATERLVEKMKKVSARNMPREAFIQLCSETVEKELKPEYVQDMKRMGMSFDFSLFYDTIDTHARRISQRSFIELYKKGREYRKDAPAMWCPQCRTGISQVECEDKEVDSFFNDIVFKVQHKDGRAEDVVIATTRPELLPACVAVMFNPEDSRYQKFKGMDVAVPLFGQTVKAIADKRVSLEKGTGIVMCCTFGDQTDMEWQKAYALPIKTAIGPDGKMTSVAGKYEGKTVHEARKEMLAELKAAGLLLAQKAIKHAVKVHERCGTEIEILKTKQWFIQYLDLREEMLEWGQKLNWYPPHMRHRYEHWVNGLQWDWMISRQRFFGVPFPVWYCKECEGVILANESDLPVDPLKHQAPVSACPKCGCVSFVPESDVMDTWATSSLTPLISTELVKDPEMRKKLFPMSLRPQAHDIITFWLFNTVVKSRLHFGVNPWKDCVISGHAQDPHGRKMSKSKGNVVEPQAMIAKYSADALRFWAAGSRLGEDLPFQEKDLVTGEKFATKLWNAARFSFLHLADYKDEKMKLELVDRWLLSKLSRIVTDATAHFNSYEYSKTKSDTEAFFWRVFCDNYLEMVKDRLYNPQQRGIEARRSAQYGLYHALLTVVKLMAPITPHITEEVYQRFYAAHEGKKSVHIAAWPTAGTVDEDAERVGDFLLEAVEHMRRAKSEKKVSLKTPVKKMFLKGKISTEEFSEILPELKSVTQAGEVEYERLPESAETAFICDLEL